MDAFANTKVNKNTEWPKQSLKHCTWMRTNEPPQCLFSLKTLGGQIYTCFLKDCEEDTA